MSCQASRPATPSCRRTSQAQADLRRAVVARKHYSLERAFAYTRRQGTCVLPPGVAWQRLLLLQEVLDDQPELARAVRRLPLREQLAMTLQLLDDLEDTRPLPANVVPFRPRTG